MSTVPNQRGSAGSEENAHQGDSWRTIGKHPLLELKHTVEDRLLVATHINFLGLRAMLHRNQDTAVLFSDTIDEPKHAGNAVGQGVLHRPPDRLLILTNKHLYIISSPSSAIFAPAAAGSAYPLSEFSRMAVISNANSAVIQFVGGIVAARFSTKKDVERCAQAVYTSTGIPTETLSAEELDQLHQRRSFGSSNKISRFVLQTVKEAKANQQQNQQDDVQSIAGGSEGGGTSVGTGATSATTNRRRILKNDNANAPNSVDNMLRFVLDGESELGQFDSGFPDVAIQATVQTCEMEVDARPQTQDASTSPIDPALLGVSNEGFGHRGGVTTRSYGRRLAEQHESDDEDGKFDVNESLWTSLRQGPSASSASLGGNRKSPGSPGLNTSSSGPLVRPSPSSQQQQNQLGKTASSLHSDPFHRGGNNDSFSFTNASMLGASATSMNLGGGGGGGGGNNNNNSAAAFDSWLGVLSTYRTAMEEHGITSVNRLLRIPQGPEWERFLDACGIQRAGHRVLLTTKANASRK